MAKDERQLTLIVPLHAARDNAACTWLRELGEQQVCGSGSEPLASLASLLSRASSFPVTTTSLRRTLCELFALRVGESLPVAALQWFADTGEVASQPLLCFDPVSLVADMDHVLLYDSSFFQIDDEEAQQLVAAINALLDSDGLQVIAPTPQRWYLSGKAVSSTRFTPLADVVGHNILPAMPAGDDAAWWRRTLNEIQMLLHSHPVNDNRVDRGAMPINGVWPWGSGTAEQTGSAIFSSCSSDDIFVKGLCYLQKVQYESVPERFDTWLATASGGEHLVQLPLVMADEAGMLCDKLLTLEQDWIVPIGKALQEGTLQACTFYIGGRLAYTLTAMDYRNRWRRLFRRHKTIQYFCQKANVV